ncbi:MAG: GGDEF domain-containing protein [Actinomycetota bacterium]|jgi:diguanylate cyclase (GGDEF)-like protein|nr:GGDEF domain-containing protein [Actinomycetota bacterium]
MADMNIDQRMEELEAELEDARAEINQLRLQLHVFTSTDAITGLSNRNGLLDSLQGAIDRQQRMDEPYCVVFMRFPQLAGLVDAHHEDDYEEALRYLGAIVAAGLRTVDQVGRLDDNTFVAVLTNCPGEHISIVIERSLASIRALPLSVGASEYALDPAVVALLSGDDATEGAEVVMGRGAQLIADAAPGEDLLIGL